jgi:hypothetical protein
MPKMIGDKGGCTNRISKEQRNEILNLFVSGRESEAIALAMELGLRQEYAYRLARERGAIPFRQKGFKHRELIGRTHLGALAAPVCAGDAG